MDKAGSVWIGEGAKRMRAEPQKHWLSHFDNAVIPEVLIPQLLKENDLAPRHFEWAERKEIIEPALRGCAVHRLGRLAKWRQTQRRGPELAVPSSRFTVGSPSGGALSRRGRRSGARLEHKDVVCLGPKDQAHSRGLCICPQPG
jgi:hypothetical protein